MGFMYESVKITREIGGKADTNVMPNMQKKRSCLNFH